MADHTPGKMDIEEQRRTYRGFLSFVKWNAITVALLLIFLALAYA